MLMMATQELIVMSEEHNQQNIMIEAIITIID